MRREISALIAAAAIGFFAGAARAQSPADAAADALIACLDISDSGERLSCLEAGANEIRALRTGAVETAATDDLFGAESLASTKRAKREDEKAARLDAGVVEIRVGPLKNVTVVLDNGQVWRQSESDRVVIRPPKNQSGLTVTITKAAFGGYWMKINELGRQIRVKRID
jgi:hypothetical protein